MSCAISPVFNYFFKVIMYHWSANFSGCCRLKGKSRTCPQKPIFLNLDWGGGEGWKSLSVWPCFLRRNPVHWFSLCSGIHSPWQNPATYSRLDLSNLKTYTDNWRIKNQLDATYYFIVFLIGSKCFGHYYAHHQGLATMVLITALVVSFLVCCMLEVRCGLAGVVVL